MAFDHDLARPVLICSTHQFARQGLDNPDALYWSAYLSGDAEYVVRGRRGTTADLSFQVLGGGYSADSAPESLAAFDDRELDIAEDGTFEWRFGPLPGAKNLIVREVFDDWDTEEPGRIWIERTDTVGLPATPAGRDRLARQYEVAGKLLTGSIRTWFAFPHFFQYQEPANTLTVPKPTPGGLASQHSSIGHYELEPDQALVVTVPACDDCSYQAIQVGSDWYASTDYETHQTSLTRAQSVVDPDGLIRYVISEQSPGIANWLETTGHRTGPIMLRWQRLDPRSLGGRRADGRGRRPRRGAVTPAPLRRGPDQSGRVRRSDRRPAARRRPEDAVVTNLLADKVVVLSGVGPGLGRSLGEEAARMGADLVLVSRTERRLEKMAEVVRSHGRRALVVPTDITDEDARVRLVEAALAEFGRVDCLINNAFGIPPMDPLTTLDLQALRDANETNVFAPLRLSALFADALAETQGSVIMLNSCVLYSSQPEYAGYKLSKGALAHLASSLATELGPRGIRVNSVAPSYIYEDVNKAYFDWLASEQGVTHEEIYRQKAEPDRPQAARLPRGGRAGRAVPRVRPRQRHHRPGPHRRLRRVPCR